MGMIVKRWTDQLQRDLYLRNGTSDITIWENTFEHGQHLPPSSMPAPRTILDLGANIGLTSAAYQWMWPEAEIVAVEMDPENAKFARRNFHGAVIEGAVVWERVEGLTYDSSVLPAQYTLGTGTTLAVQVPLKEILRDYFRGGDVDFCKMDIEGTEEELLAHAAEWSSQIHHLLIECHVAVADYSHEDAMEDLKAAGYKVGVSSPERQAVWAWTPTG